MDKMLKSVVKSRLAFEQKPSSIAFVQLTLTKLNMPQATTYTDLATAGVTCGMIGSSRALSHAGCAYKRGINGVN